MRPLLEDHPLLDGFLALPGDGLADVALHLAPLAKQLRELGAETLVQLHPGKLTQLAGWRAGIPQRVGYRSAVWLDWTLTERRADRRQEGRQHEAQYNFELLRTLGIEAPPLAELRPQVHLSERCRTSLRAQLSALGCADPGSYLVLNPTAYSLTHRWPAKHFVWLARELRSLVDRFILVGEHTADPACAILRESLADLGPHHFVDLSGKLNLGELGWLLQGARLLVSRNTGTAHLAAAVGCPLVELFGRVDAPYGPKRWHALGSRIFPVVWPVTERRPGESKQAFWRRGFESITREAVRDAAHVALAAPR